MKNEKKKPTMQEKDSLAGGVEVGWKWVGSHENPKALTAVVVKMKP